MTMHTSSSQMASPDPTSHPELQMIEGSFKHIPGAGALSYWLLTEVKIWKYCPSYSKACAHLLQSLRV